MLQNKSYVEYECDYAIRNNLPIIVLYNSTTVDKSKCIDSVVSVAKAHAQMIKRGGDNKLNWDYQQESFIVSEYDEELVARPIKQVSVPDANTLLIAFKGGYMIEQAL